MVRTMRSSVRSAIRIGDIVTAVFLLRSGCFLQAALSLLEFEKIKKIAMHVTRRTEAAVKNRIGRRSGISPPGLSCYRVKTGGRRRSARAGIREWRSKRREGDPKSVGQHGLSPCASTCGRPNGMLRDTGRRLPTRRRIRRGPWPKHGRRRTRRRVRNSHASFSFATTRCGGT